MRRGVVRSIVPGLKRILFFSTLPKALFKVPNSDSLLNTEGEPDPWDACYSARRCWEKLQSPVREIPAEHIGLDNLRKVAQKGVHTVIPYFPPRAYSLDKVRTIEAAHRLLFAGDVVYAPPTGSLKQQLNGLLFHPGNSTLTAHVRGEANPHLGVGNILGRNKLWEAKLVAKVDPTLMPETIAIADLPIFNSESLIKLRQMIIERIHDFKKLPFKRPSFTQINAEITMYIEYIFSGLRSNFSAGAFIKPVESSCSGDCGLLYTTMKTKPEHLATRFIDGFINNVSLLSSPPDILRQQLLEQDDAAVLLVHDLLFSPREVIGQEALKLATTKNGELFEVRVDFLQGRSIQSLLRYSLLEYYPEQEKAAREFLNHFFSKVNYPNNTLCGGADIALGLDGKWHFIEFNLGSESASLQWGIRWNIYVSNVLGRKTALISTLDRIFGAPLARQMQCLKKLEMGLLNHPEVNNLIHVYIWFRDRYCQTFAEKPSDAHKDRILVDLKQLFSIAPKSLCYYTARLIEGAAAYMSRRGSIENKLKATGPIDSIGSTTNEKCYFKK